MSKSLCLLQFEGVLALHRIMSICVVNPIIYFPRDRIKCKVSS
jgi:hypothetical protein